MGSEAASVPRPAAHLELSVVGHSPRGPDSIAGHPKGPGPTQGDRMSDQQPPEHQDTAAVAGPNEAPGTAQEQAEVDWQKRYNDLQPEYTRTTQSLREAEQKQ